MEKQIQNELEEAKTTADILWSTLLAIHMAQEQEVFDSNAYKKAIQGTVYTAYGLTKKLNDILNDSLNTI